MAKPVERGANPFEYGQAVAPATLVDRVDELRRVVESVTSGGRLFLIGPRRYGKTSLLNLAEAELAKRGIAVLRVDAEKFETPELLARALLAAAVRALGGRLDRIGRTMRGVFGALRPDVTYNIEDGTISVGFNVQRPPATSDIPLVADVLDGINALAKTRRKRALVVIDEFQQLVTEGGITAERQLRSVIQTHQHLSYVFAGSKTRLLIDMTSDHARPFYKLGAALVLGPVPRKDFRVFLARGFTAGGTPVTAEGVERILDLAEDVPYNVQRLASRCWDLLGAAPATRLDVAFVDYALERVVREDDAIYTQLWISLTEVQKKSLKAVIAAGGTRLMSQSVAREHGVAPPSMQTALKALERRGIVRDEHTLGAVRVRLEDPFFASWLRLSQRT
jgi:uncharacterized protein